MRFELSEAAIDDIRDIIAYGLERFGRYQTDQYVDGLFFLFDILTDNPRMGAALGEPELGNVRRLLYRSHWIFYEVRDDVIKIGMIRSARQKLPPEWME